MPEENLDRDLRRHFAQVIETTPPLQALLLDPVNRPKGALRRWRIQGRMTWIAGVAAIAAVVVILSFILPSSSGIINDSRLGLTVSGAAVTPTSSPRITFKVGYLPSDFHLIGSIRETDLVSPENSSEGLTYERSSAAGSGKLTIVVKPAIASGTPKLNLGPNSHSIAGPVIGSAHSVFATSHPRDHVLITGPCSTFEQAGPNERSAVEFLAWKVPSGKPGVSFAFDVYYQGKSALPEQSFFRIAEGVRFQATSWNCWSNSSGLLQQSSTGGTCSPGQVGSAESDPSLVGGSAIARGSLSGTPWKFVVATETCHLGQNGAPRSATSFGLIGGNGLSCGGSTSPTSEFSESEANITVENLANGQRVACGSVPSNVTSLTVISREGPGVSEPVLPTRRVGSAFFVMSLGKVGATCYYVCKGSITVNLFVGSKLVSSHKWQELATETSGQTYGVKA